ncbi:MAG TPA: hypothetical protein VFC38_07000 [Stellaceae bacterium]|nr:hypothetical protein [Stellaceae bacterium]
MSIRSWIVEKSRIWLEPSIRTIVYVVIAAWVVTVIVWIAWALKGMSGNEHVLLDVFAAWTGELLFFTIVGFVVAAVGLHNPAQEPLSQRIRILYGTPDVPEFALQYNAGQLRKLAAYSPTANRSITIEEYNAGYAAYKVRVASEYTIKNMLRDASYEDVISVNFAPDRFDNPPPEVGRLRSVRIGTQERLRGPIAIDPAGYNSTFPITIPPNETSSITVEYTMWWKVGEEQSMVPQRLVEHFSMVIVSDVESAVRIDKGVTGGIVDLVYHAPHRFAEVRTVSPQESLFSFKLLLPL